MSVWREEASTVSKLNVRILAAAAGAIIDVGFQFAPHEKQEGEIAHCTTGERTETAPECNIGAFAGRRWSGGRKGGREGGRDGRCLLSGFALPLHPSSELSGRDRSIR